MTTEPNIISDHCTLTMNILDKVSIQIPKFYMKRNFKLLTADRLKFAVQKNHKLQNLTRQTDPNIVACTLNDELNSITNLIAPSTKCINKADNLPYMTQDLRNEKSTVNALLTNAIKTEIKDDWRNYHNCRNIFYKKVNIAKEKFMSSQLNDKVKGWRNIKQYNGLNKSTIPSKIIFEGQVVTSPKEIANIANNHYKN